MTATTKTLAVLVFIPLVLTRCVYEAGSAFRAEWRELRRILSV